MTHEEKRQLIEGTKAVLEKLRQEYGESICTDLTINGDLIEYQIMPDDVTGYTRQINTETGKSRHCGNGKGCFLDRLGIKGDAGHPAKAKGGRRDGMPTDHSKRSSSYPGAVPKLYPVCDG